MKIWPKFVPYKSSRRGSWRPGTLKGKTFSTFSHLYIPIRGDLGQKNFWQALPRFRGALLILSVPQCPTSCGVSWLLARRPGGCQSWPVGWTVRGLGREIQCGCSLWACAQPWPHLCHHASLHLVPEAGQQLRHLLGQHLSNIVIVKYNH